VPTEIEQSYVDQGYRLPEGLTWDMVAERRIRWDIPGIFVPIAVARRRSSPTATPAAWLPPVSAPPSPPSTWA